MAGVALPPWYLFGLRQLSPGSAGSLEGLVVTSKRAHAVEDFPGLLLLAPASGWGAPPQRAPPTLAGSFGSVSCVVIAPFLWILVHPRFCLCPPRWESLFPPVLWKSYSQTPLAFKVRFARDS